MFVPSCGTTSVANSGRRVTTQSGSAETARAVLLLHFADTISDTSLTGKVTAISGVSAGAVVDSTVRAPTRIAFFEDRQVAGTARIPSKPFNVALQPGALLGAGRVVTAVGGLRNRGARGRLVG